MAHINRSEIIEKTEQSWERFQCQSGSSFNLWFVSLTTDIFQSKWLWISAKSLCVLAREPYMWEKYETKTGSVIPKLIKAETLQAPNSLTSREILGKWWRLIARQGRIFNTSKFTFRHWIFDKSAIEHGSVKLKAALILHVFPTLSLVFDKISQSEGRNNSCPDDLGIEKQTKNILTLKPPVNFEWKHS